LQNLYDAPSVKSTIEKDFFYRYERLHEEQQLFHVIILFHACLWDWNGWKDVSQIARHDGEHNENVGSRSSFNTIGVIVDPWILFSSIKWLIGLVNCHDEFPPSHLPLHRLDAFFHDFLVFLQYQIKGGTLAQSSE
jgi:hypothetical protein